MYFDGAVLNRAVVHINALEKLIVNKGALERKAIVEVLSIKCECIRF